MLVSANKMSQFDTSMKVVLFLCTKNHGNKTVVVTKNSTISILDLLYKNTISNPIYIHNGVILDKKMKFINFPNIQNESNIFVAHDSNEYFKTNVDYFFNVEKSWLSQKNVKFQALMTADNSFRQEMFRLNDLRLTRYEGKRKIKIISDEKRKIKSDHYELVAPEVHSISNEALPKFWKISNIKN